MVRREQGRLAGEGDDLAAVGRLEDGPGQRLLRRPERDLAAVQAQDAVEAAGLLQVVRRDEEGATLTREVDEEPLEEVGTRLVDARERLVEEQHRRVLDERAGDEHALALAAGELAELLAGERGEADAVERGERSAAVGAPDRTPPGHARERPH